MFGMYVFFALEFLALHSLVSASTADDDDGNKNDTYTLNEQGTRLLRR